MHLKKGIFDEDYTLADAIFNQNKVNKAYRVKHNMNGLLDPINKG